MVPLAAARQNTEMVLSKEPSKTETSIPKRELPKEIRLAAPSDEAEIFALLLMMHAENGVFSVDRLKVREGIKQGTERRGGMVFVIDGPTQIEATIGLVLSPAAWYTSDVALHEMWNFVHPDYRRSPHAKNLIEAAKWASGSLSRAGMPLTMAVVSNIRTEAKCRLYRRLVPAMGQFFVYNWPNKHSNGVASSALR